MTYYNKISNAQTPGGIPFISENRQVLDKFSSIDNKNIYFNGKRLGQALTISEYNGADQENSNSLAYSNINSIVFQGADVKQNPYNHNQIRVKIKNVQQIIDPNGQTTIVNDYYKLKQLDIRDGGSYEANVKQYLICKGSCIIKLPKDVQDMDYIKIATLGNVNQKNTVTIQTRVLGAYINSTNQNTLVINSPYSSVELVFSFSIRTWLVLTPFIPIQSLSDGLDEQQAKNLAKKQMLIFG